MTVFVPAPPAAVTRVLAAFDRQQLEGFVAVAIDLLDLADGDADEENATDAEDEGLTANALEFAAWSGPGCPVADPDKCVDDDGEPDHDGEFSLQPTTLNEMPD